MEYKPSLSGDVVLSLEDELDGGVIPQVSDYYRSLWETIPQDYLDNFLTWFGSECIRRYCEKTTEQNNIG